MEGFCVTNNTGPPASVSSVCYFLVELSLPAPVHPGEGGPWSGQLLHLQVGVPVCVNMSHLL